MERTLIQDVVAQAYAARRDGRLDEALRLYGEAAAVYRADGNALRLAHQLRHIGDIWVQKANLDEAGPYYREALEIHRANPEGPALDFANALRAVAIFHAKSGEQVEEAKLWAEAKPLYEDAGVQAGVDEADRQMAMFAKAPSAKGATTYQPRPKA
jgi:tetratricopeptide (TPR) repeat protein